MQALKSERSVAVLSVPTERVAYLFVNPSAGPTKDVHVRRAIAMAIDRDTLISALQQGYARPVAEVLTPANFGYSDAVPAWPFDPDVARKMIADAGAKGATVQFLTSPVYDRRLNEAVQQMLADVGLNVEIVMLDQPTYLKRRQGTPEDAGGLSQGRWSCACQDADGVIFPLFRSGSIWSKYSNPEYDRLVDAARSTLDEGKRRDLYRQAFTILHDDVPGIGLFQDVAINGASGSNEAMFVFEMSWAQ